MTNIIICQNNPKRFKITEFAIIMNGMDIGLVIINQQYYYPPVATNVSTLNVFNIDSVLFSSSSSSSSELGHI